MLPSLQALYSVRLKKLSYHLFFSSWAVAADEGLLRKCGIGLSPHCGPLSRYSREGCHISHPPQLLPDSKAPLENLLPATSVWLDHQGH